MSKQKDEFIVATLTIHNAAELSKPMAKKLIKWLESQKETVLNERKDLSKRFTARLYGVRK